MISASAVRVKIPGFKPVWVSLSFQHVKVPTTRLTGADPEFDIFRLAYRTSTLWAIHVGPLCVLTRGSCLISNCFPVWTVNKINLTRSPSMGINARKMKKSIKELVQIILSKPTCLISSTPELSFAFVILQSITLISY